MSDQRPPWADAYPAGVPLHLEYDDTTVLDLWERAVRRHRGKAAFDFLGRTTTYGAAADQVERVAGGLHRLGVRAGDNVALVMPTCPQNVVAFFAVLRLGATVVEHNPLYTAAELRGPFADHGAKVAIVWDKAVPVVEELREDTPLEHVVAVDLTAELPLAKRIALRLPIARARASRDQLTAPAPGAMPWAELATGGRDPSACPFPTSRSAWPTPTTSTETCRRAGEASCWCAAPRSSTATAGCPTRPPRPSTTGGVAVEGVPVEAEDLKLHSRQGLTPYKVPRRVVFVDELPTNPMGKVLRREVAAKLRSHLDRK